MTFKKGQSGNPLGRPQGARSKFSEKAVAELLEDWTANGADVLQRVRLTDPAAYLRVAFSIIPKEVDLSIMQTHGGLDADQWESVTRIAGVLRQIAPQATPDEIEHVLRAGFARQIEHLRE